MDTLTLREAARRTSRSVTTLRRYIRSGRLRAVKRPGRFGPEYLVSEQQLGDAGLRVTPVEAAPPAPLETTRSGPPAPPVETVPVSLYQELQMKHEQLLVQYGMMRASGRRTFEFQAELEAARRELRDHQVEHAAARRRQDQEIARLKRQLGAARSEHEGQQLEAAALREKVRGLEMITRNRRTSQDIDKQFHDVLEQSERVERLSEERKRAPADWPDDTPGRDH